MTVDVEGVALEGARGGSPPLVDAAKAIGFLLDLNVDVDDELDILARMEGGRDDVADAKESDECDSRSCRCGGASLGSTGPFNGCILGLRYDLSSSSNEEAVSNSINFNATALSVLSSSIVMVSTSSSAARAI